MKSSKTDREENLISKGVSACSECIFNRKKLIVKTSKNSVYSAHLLLNRSPMNTTYMLNLYCLPLPFLRFGETIIAMAKNTADTTTIDAPIGKSVISDR